MTMSVIKYPDGGTETFDYTQNNFGEPTSHTMVSKTSAPGSGGTEHFTYNVRGQLTQSYPPATGSDGSPQSHPTIYTYDPVTDCLKTRQDPRGYTTAYVYSARGLLKSVTNPDTDASQTVYKYNPNGTLLSVAVDYAANTAAVTTYDYDDYKRITSVTTPQRFTGDSTPRTTNFYYGPGDNGLDDYTHTDANVTRTVLPSGKVIKKVYDANKRPSTVTTGYGTGDAATTGYTYDAVGNLTTMTEPKYYPGGAHWIYDYDVRNRVDWLTDPVLGDRNAGGHTVDYAYDDASNKTSEVRANDQTINYVSYDKMNRLTQMNVGQAPTATAVTSYSWTKAGKVDSMTDPNGNLYSYSYDAQNRLAIATYPNNKTETRSYDYAGNPTAFKNRAGDTQTFTYDVRNREKSYTWDDDVTPSRTLTYDDASRILSCNTVNTFITNTYFNDSRLKSQEDWATGSYGNGTHRILSYSYDADGNRASATLPGVLGLSYDYTARNQVRHATSGVIDATYGYDLNGNVSSRALSNSTASTFDYDALNRIKTITHNLAGGDTRTLSYGYDEVGNRLSEQRNGFAFATLGYDKNSQMTSFSQSGASTNLTYDASGNRKTLGSSTSYGTANSLNQYPTVGGAGLTYDGDGNLKSFNNWTYSYDSLNRLTGASGPGGASASFYYDGLNRQVSRVIDGALTVNVWDGWKLFAEYGSGGVLKNVPIYGAGSDLLGQSAAGLGTTFFYPDGSGNTAFLADTGGNLLEKYTYDLAGTPTYYDASGNVLPNGSAYKVDMLFTGQKWYAEMGVYDLRNRAYLPSLGRFLQPDPIGFAGDASNLYRYGANNPVNSSDPSGLWSPWAWISKIFSINGTQSWVSNATNQPVTRYGAPPTGSNIPSTQQYTPNGVGYDRVDHDVINGYTDRGAYTSGGTPIPRATAVDGGGGIGGFIGKIWALPNTILGLAADVILAPIAIAHGGGFQLGNNSIQLVGLPFGNGALTLGNTQLYFNKTPGSNEAYGQNGAYYGPHEEGHTYQNQILGPFFLPAYFLSGHPFTLDNPFEAGAQAYAFAHPPGG